MAAPTGSRPALGFLPRPLDVGEIADRSLLVYRRNFLVLYTLALVPSALAQSANWLLLAGTMGGGTTAAGAAAQLIATLGYLFITLCVVLPLWHVSVAGTAWGAAEAYLGRPVELRQAFRHAVRAMPKLLATLVVIWIALVVFCLVPSLLAATLAAVGLVAAFDDVIGAILSLFVFALALGPFLYFMLRLLLCTPVVVLEGRWFHEAIARSWTLMGHRPAGTRWHSTPSMRAAWLLLLLSGLTLGIWALGVLPQVVLTVVAAIRSAGEPPSGASPANPFDVPVPALVASQIFTLFVQGLVQPLFWLFVTVLYFDLRARREGLDLHILVGRLRKSRDAEAK